MVLGGGGSPAPIQEMMLQVLLAGLFAAWLWVLPAGKLRALPREVWLLAGLVVALPALQLVPLPPPLWHALPGRQSEIEALALLGKADSWQPISLAPRLTLASLLVMLAFSTVLVMGAALNRAGRTLVLATIVAVALLSMVVGAGQMVGEHGNIFRFYNPTSGWLSGFQANHNSEADVLLVAIVACAAVAREIPAGRNRGFGLRYILGVAGVIMAVLVLGVVLSASRTGMALLAVSLSGALVILRPIIHLTWRQTLIVSGVGAALLLGNNQVIAHALGRFRTIQEMRPEIWRDSLFAAGNHLPLGGGMGSFVPVFGGVEPVDAVSSTYANRAHNDFLELLVEGGLVGVLWGGAILGLLARAALGALKKQGGRIREGVSRGQVVCAITILCEIGLHSLLDYPLRSMAISGIAAIAAGLLIIPPELSLRANAWKEQP